MSSEEVIGFECFDIIENHCKHSRRCQLEAANELHNGLDHCPDCGDRWFNLKHPVEYITLTLKTE